MPDTRTSSARLSTGHAEFELDPAQPGPFAGQVAKRRVVRRRAQACQYASHRSGCGTERTPSASIPPKSSGLQV